VMGILNVTPDSFSDGGRFTSEEAIQAQAEEMLAQGVDIIDIGGESTRPFAEPVAMDEELRRVLPAIRAVRRLSDSIPISIDTTKADVARQALDSGADIINDISGLRFDPGMAVLARERGCEVVIMHMKGTPRDMQLNPQYRDVVAEIMEFFQERIQWAADMGIDRSRLILDPGIGFGKTVEHNLTLLREAGRFKELGCRVLVGHSRKSFIGKLLDLPVAARDNATAALSCLLAASGVDILRVHDVGATRQAVELAWAVTGGLRQE